MTDETKRIIDQSVVDAAFQSLGREQQQLLLWHKVDNLTYDEMAARLGISRKTLTRKMAALVYAWCRAVERAAAPSCRAAQLVAVWRVVFPGPECRGRGRPAKQGRASARDAAGGGGGASGERASPTASRNSVP